MLVVGCVSTIVFVAWEKYGAKHPLMPFYLFTNRTVLVSSQWPLRPLSALIGRPIPF